MEFTREHQNLTEYRAELEAAEARLQDAEADVVALGQIVAGIEARLAKAEGKGAAAPEEVPQESATSKPQKQAAKPPRKRRGLKKALRKIMADGETRTVDDILAALGETEAFRDALPARTSLSNRLWELTQDGCVESVGKGVYRGKVAQNGRAPEGLRLTPV